MKDFKETRSVNVYREKELVGSLTRAARGSVILERSEYF